MHSQRSNRGHPDPKSLLTPLILALLTCTTYLGGLHASVRPEVDFAAHPMDQKGQQNGPRVPLGPGHTPSRWCNQFSGQKQGVPPFWSLRLGLHKYALGGVHGTPHGARVPTITHLAEPLKMTSFHQNGKPSEAHKEKQHKEKVGEHKMRPNSPHIDRNAKRREPPKKT